jgi:hypothetical protein
VGGLFLRVWGRLWSDGAAGAGVALRPWLGRPIARLVLSPSARRKQEATNGNQNRYECSLVHRVLLSGTVCRRPTAALSTIVLRCAPEHRGARDEVDFVGI